MSVRRCSLVERELDHAPRHPEPQLPAPNLPSPSTKFIVPRNLLLIYRRWDCNASQGAIHGMAASSIAAAGFSLNDLCDELLLNIFHFLDVPDLLAASRVSEKLWMPMDHSISLSHGWGS